MNTCQPITRFIACERATCIMYSIGLCMCTDVFNLSKSRVCTPSSFLIRYHHHYPFPAMISRIIFRRATCSSCMQKANPQTMDTLPSPWCRLPPNWPTILFFFIQHYTGSPWRCGARQPTILHKTQWNDLLSWLVYRSRININPCSRSSSSY